MKLPEGAFVAPDGSNRDVVERLLNASLNTLLSHLTSASTRRLLPDVLPALDALELPRRGSSEDALLAEVESLLSYCMNQANPGYIGHMDPMPTTASIVGELVGAAVNNNMLSVEMSPLFSKLEYRLMQVFAREFGLGMAAGGVALSGGTLANLQALAVARNTAFDVHENGMMQVGGSPVILVSEAAHVSFKKAAMLLGLGTRAVISIPSDPLSRMKVDSLNAIITQLRLDGRHPFCIVGTAGTTTTGSIDPLDKIADVAYRHGLWFHVDAAYGGALQFSETHKHRLEGIERADSITFNPQKWFYVARTSAMLLLRDLSLLNTHFRQFAPYMGTDDETPNLGEISVQGTRFAEVLKLWLTLKHLGLDGLSALVDQGCELAQYLHSQARQREILNCAGPVETNLVCFRGEPKGLGPRACDKWNTHLQAYLQERGIYLSLPLYRGVRWLRAVVLNPYTNRDTIDQMFELIDEFAKRDPATVG